MIELFCLFEDGEIINLKFSESNLDNLDDSEIFEIFEIEHKKRFGIYSSCKYLSGSLNFD